MFTFLRSLRPGPAPLDVFGEGRSAGPGLRSQGTLGQEELSRWRARGIQGVDVPTLAPARSRSRFVEAQEGSGDVRRRCAPTGRRIPARGETPGMAHNQSVLKERRIPTDSLACFAVAECRGWRWGSVPRRRLEDIGRGGSAGPGLRSQGTLGQVGLSRWRATGIIGCRRSYARFGPVPRLLWDAASRWMPCFVRARLLWAIIGSSGSLRLLVGGENLEKRHWDSSWRTRASRAGRMPL